MKRTDLVCVLEFARAILGRTNVDCTVSFTFTGTIVQHVLLLIVLVGSFWAKSVFTSGVVSNVRSF